MTTARTCATVVSLPAGLNSNLLPLGPEGAFVAEHSFQCRALTGVWRVAEFSLGYGAKILLNNTRLHLKRGKRYGVCGHNGCGKTTLMRAIANGQVHAPHPSLACVRPCVCARLFGVE